MTQVGTEFHLAWNGEDVYLGSLTADPTTDPGVGVIIRNKDNALTAVRAHSMQEKK